MAGGEITDIVRRNHQTKIRLYIIITMLIYTGYHRAISRQRLWNASRLVVP